MLRLSNFTDVPCPCALSWVLAQLVPSKKVENVGMMKGWLALTMELVCCVSCPILTLHIIKQYFLYYRLALALTATRIVSCPCFIHNFKQPALGISELVEIMIHCCKNYLLYVLHYIMNIGLKFKSIHRSFYKGEMCAPSFLSQPKF